MNKKQKDIITKIHDFVKKESKTFADDDVFSNHVLNVIKYSKILAKKYNANMFVVVVAAYLHDIYHLQTHDHKIHEIEGAKFAKNYLKRFDIKEKEITLICACILNHRGSKDRPRISIEEKIVACADAMDHINRWTHMFYRKSRLKEYDGTIEWMRAKLERGWKKLELPEARYMVKEKYLAAKLSLKNSKIL